MSNQTNLVGAFSPYTCNIDGQAQDAFNEAMKSLLGVKYTAVAVSQQVVAGMNYKFFCNAEGLTFPPTYTAAIVSVYKPLQGEAHVTHIQTI